jgi:hypothetical protein
MSFLLKFKKRLSKKRKSKNTEINLSIKAEIEYSNEIDWLESIKEKYYDYSDFKGIQVIGRDSFGSATVIHANWKNGFVALKSFNNDILSLCRVVE